MTDYANDIKRYRNGEMTPAEMHALEKKALSDPFLADALEGAMQLTGAEFSEDAENLNKHLQESILREAQPIAAAAAPRMKVEAEAAEVFMSPVPKVTAWKWTLRIAAGLALLITATFVIWKTSSTLEEPQPFAMKKSTVQAETAAPADTIASEAAVETETTQASGGPVVQTQDIASSSTQRTRSEEKPVTHIAETQPVTEADEQPAGELQAQAFVAEERPIEEIKPEEEPKQTEKIAEVMAAQKEDIRDELAIKDKDDAQKKTAGRAMGVTAKQKNSTIIRGKVTSADDGSALPGINVIIKGTTKGTVTDEAGNYQVESDEPQPSLVFSFIGLQTQEVDAGEREVVDVALSLDEMQLSEVVVTGYGADRSGPYTPTVDLAHPENGNRAFKQYLEKSIQYPEEALDNKVEGRVTVEFFVEADGSLTDFTVVKGIGSGCDEELIRLIKEGPRWIPTKKDDVPMRDKARVRLKFELPKK